MTTLKRFFIVASAVGLVAAMMSVPIVNAPSDVIKNIEADVSVFNSALLPIPSTLNLSQERSWLNLLPTPGVRMWPMYLPNDDDGLLQSLLRSVNVIDLEAAWDITQGSPEVLVAVIDDAIDIHHPDLAQNMAIGWDFVEGDADPSPSASNQCGVEKHGTWVASVIGAVGDNQRGIAGISYRTRILPLRIGCEYNAEYERAAIIFAVSKGAKIINMSYGGYVFSPHHDEIVQILEDNQVLLVTAAGNYHGDNDQSSFYPADINSPSVITVAATTKAGVLTHWSNYGATSVDVAAPGVKLTVANYDPSQLRRYISLDSTGFSGTSASTPVVAGLAALLMAQDLLDGQQDDSIRDIKAAIIASVQSTDIVGKLRADGVVNAARALDEIQQPHPVLLLSEVRIDDSAGNNNGVLDAWENASLRITLENIWQTASNVDATLHLQSAVMVFDNKVANFGRMLPGERVTRAYRFSTMDIDRRHQFDVTLDLSSTGITNSREKRYFSLQTGPLQNGVAVEDTIQQTAYDERHYYHIQLEDSMEQLVFELNYRPTNGRDLGIMVQSQEIPRIDFLNASRGGTNYYGARYSTAKSGVKRIEIARQAFIGQTYYAMVYNHPANDNASTYPFNRLYSLRACLQYLGDELEIPVVEVGKDVRVEANTAVVIQGSAAAFNEGSSLVNIWWEQTSGPEVPLSGEKSLTLNFIAPRTGAMIFALNVSDSQCRHNRKTIRVTVNDEADQVNGLRLLPNTASVSIGGFISTNISATVNNIPVTGIIAKSLPDGAHFNAANNVLSWANARPVGTHFVKFVASDPSDETQALSANFTVTVRKPVSQRSESGGCVVLGATSYDPLLGLVLLFSIISIRIFSRRVNYS